MESLFGKQKRLLAWIVESLDWACDRSAYVTNGRPIYFENAVNVWRSAGPRPTDPNVKACASRDEIELTVACITCCGTSIGVMPDGTLIVPTADEWEEAARRHETDLEKIYGLLKHHAGWLGKIKSEPEAEPDGDTLGGCYGTTIRITVPYQARKICENPPLPPPEFDDVECC